METVFLLLACLFFAFQFVFQKLFERRTLSGLRVCLWNELICCSVMAIFLFLKSGIPQTPNVMAFVYIFAYAASNILCSVCVITSLRYGSVSTLSTFCLAGGMIVPYVYGIAFLHETASLTKWLGILVLCVSLVPSLMQPGEKSRSGNLKKFALFCCIVFLSNGMISVFSKMHQISPAAIAEDSFVFYSALLRLLTALLVLGISALVRTSRGNKKAFRETFWEVGRQPMCGRMFAALVLISGSYAVCNTLGNIFSLRCMITMDASIQFPLLSAIIIVMSAFLGRIFFGEKIRRNTAISLVLSAIGICLFMIP